ncbi:MAG: tetratricopeptide repeat protein, partial [Planctomycetota bacterium]|nr:tetratricopeptide repeat protein [Planctomycetota bacterium]
RVLGEEHPQTLLSISIMGDLLHSQGNLAEAEPYFRDALEKRRRVLGEEHPQTLLSINNMGSLLHSQGKFAEAEPYCCEALEKCRRVLGEEHPHTIISVSLTARLKLDQDRAQEALELITLYEPSARKQFTGGDARRLADFLTALGRARVGVGFDAEGFKLAEANLLEAHPIFVQAKGRGPAHKDTLTCVQALVDLYTAWDKAEPGKGYAAKATEWQHEREQPPAPPAPPAPAAAPALPDQPATP